MNATNSLSFYEHFGGSGWEIFFYPSWRYPPGERGWPVWFFIPTRWVREKGAPRRNEEWDGIEVRWREKEEARPPGYSWRIRFRLWWAHRRRPSREKPVIGRWVRRRSLPPARWSRDKKGELLSRPLGERSRDGNPGEGYSPGGRSLLSVPSTRAHGSSSLNFGSDMIIDIAVRLTYLHRRRMDGWRSVILLFDNFGEITSTATKDKLVVCFMLHYFCVVLY